MFPEKIIDRLKHRTGQNETEVVHGILGKKTDFSLNREMGFKIAVHQLKSVGWLFS